MEQNELPKKIGEVLGAFISLSCFAMLLYSVVIAL